MKIEWRQVYWVVLFSIAMGFLETAVVVYLRELYYPGGFQFPLSAMNPHIVFVELMREAATIIMLAGVGILAGRTPLQRLAFFLGSFAIWDLTYYIFLKALLDWPASLMTWDILFLIPVPWVGPVLAPCLISLTMLLLAAALYYRDAIRPGVLRLNGREWAGFVVGSQVVIFSWTWDYFKYLSLASSSQSGLEVLRDYIPADYPWWLFISGEGLLLATIYLFWKRTASYSAQSSI